MNPCNRFYNTGTHAHMYNVYLLGHGQSAYTWLGMHSFWPLKALGLPEEIAVVLPCPCGDRPNRRNHWFQHQPLFDEQQEPQPSYQSSPRKKIFCKNYVLTKGPNPLDPGFLGSWQFFMLLTAEKFQQMFEFGFLWNLTKFELIQTTFTYFYFSKGEPLEKTQKCFLNEKLKIKAF